MLLLAPFSLLPNALTLVCDMLIVFIVSLLFTSLSCAPTFWF